MGVDITSYPVLVFFILINITEHHEQEDQYIELIIYSFCKSSLIYELISSQLTNDNGIERHHVENQIDLSKKSHDYLERRYLITLSNT
jgi:hypothetical protein